MKQTVLRERQAPRPAHDRHALPLAVARGAWRRDARAVELQIAGDDQIQPTVEIEVEERAAGVPALSRGGDPGSDRHVTERAVAFVAVERRLTEVGDEKIALAVVVIVGGADALRPADAPQAGAGRHVFEPQLPAIAIEMAGGASALTVAVERRGVGDEHIGKVVVVVIENGDAGARGLEDVLLPVVSPEIVRAVSPADSATSR